MNTKDIAKQFQEDQEKVGATRVFTTGASRGVDSAKLDYEGFLAPSVLRRYAEYMHECRLLDIPPGQNIRSSDNWQKGIPLDTYMKSMIRHVVEVWSVHRRTSPLTPTGEKMLQDTLCAIMFNAMGYLFETVKAKNDHTG